MADWAADPADAAAAEATTVADDAVDTVLLLDVLAVFNTVVYPVYPTGYCCLSTCFKVEFEELLPVLQLLLMLDT